MFTPKATEVLLKNVRLSYVHLMEPYTGVNQSKPKYSTTILLPKSDVAQKQAIDAAIAAAIEEGRQKYGAKSVPAKPKQPVWDGDGYTQNGKEFGPEAKGHWVFTAWQDAKYKVEVVDMSGNPITDHTQVYSGMYANVLVNFYYYDNQSQGVGCSLGPVQNPLAVHLSRRHRYSEPLREVLPTYTAVQMPLLRLILSPVSRCRPV